MDLKGSLGEGLECILVLPAFFLKDRNIDPQAQPEIPQYQIEIPVFLSQMNFEDIFNGFDKAVFYGCRPDSCPRLLTTQGKTAIRGKRGD